MPLTKPRTNCITTVHTLLVDVPNPFAAVCDQRRRDTWFTKPVTKAGTRLAITRDYRMNEDVSHIPEARKFEGCSACIQPESGRGYFTGHGEIGWVEHRKLDEETVEMKLPGQRYSDEGITGAPRKRLEAKAELIRALLANLSQPVEDFDATMASAEHTADHILHKLFLLGKISLNDIKTVDQEG